MVLRPDEEANIKETERDKRFRSTLSSIGKTGVGLATGLGATSLSSRLLPFLSEHIPLDLAMKGINKLSPKLGKFLKEGQSMGLDVKKGLDFIKEKVGPKEKRNIIEQYSPELHNFLKQEIGQGRAPVEAAALATLPAKNRDFNKAIKKLEADHKTSFDQIVQSVFGTAQQPQQQAQSQQQAPQGQQNKKNIQDPLQQALITGDAGELSKILKVKPEHALKIINTFNQKQQPQQTSQQPQQGQQPQGNTDQALMAALEKILQM